MSSWAVDHELVNRPSTTTTAPTSTPAFICFAPDAIKQ
jgi:hypothetical protein